jgi:hypothetical protein
MGVRPERYRFENRLLRCRRLAPRPTSQVLTSMSKRTQGRRLRLG